MKTKCKTCSNENKGKCSIKHTTVNVNKNRKCNYYELEPDKVKIKEILPSRPATEDEMFKQKPKGVKSRKVARMKSKEINMNTNEQHPMTGDLSRFKSSATRTD
jgi:hypothetical protein